CSACLRSCWALAPSPPHFEGGAPRRGTRRPTPRPGASCTPSCRWAAAWSCSSAGPGWSPWRSSSVAKGRGATTLDHIPFVDQRAPREAGERERRDVDIGALVEQQLGQEQRRSRGLHEPVPAEPGRAPEALDLRHRPEDRLMVGRRLIQAGPRRFDPRAGQGGSTGISSPAIRPMEDDHAPAQLKTTRLATSPAEVRTPCTRPPATSIPTTSTPSFSRAPWRREASA